MEGIRLDHIHIEIHDGVIVAIRGLVGSQEHSLTSIREVSYEKIPAPIFPLIILLIGLGLFCLFTVAQLPENYAFTLSTLPPNWEFIAGLLVATAWAVFNRRPTFRIDIELASGVRFFYESQDRAGFRRVASALMGAVD